MRPSTLPRPTGCNPLHFTAMTALLVLLSLAYLGNLAMSWANVAASADPRTTDRRPVQVSAGRHELLIPANMIPRPEQRIQGQRSERLALEMSWPQLEGFSSDTQAAEVWISVDLIATRSVATLSERLDSVYRRLATSHDTQGPAGLALLDMSGKAGSGDDVIVFEAGQPNGFIARCQTPADGPARCFRDLRLADDLVVSYRFQRSALANWGRMDRRILDRIDGMRLN